VFHKDFYAVFCFELANETRVPAVPMENERTMSEAHCEPNITRVHLRCPDLCSIASKHYSCTPLWQLQRPKARSIPALLEQSRPTFNKHNNLTTETAIRGGPHLPRHTSAYSRLTILGPTLVSVRGARPQPPGPKALLRILRYLISGR